MMTLLEVTGSLASLDDASTIYAAEPWTPESAAVVAAEPLGGGVPAEAGHLGCKYFLEVVIAREFLDGWKIHFAGTPTIAQQCERLIQYAVTDA